MLLVTASLGRVRFPPPAPPPRVFGNFVELRGGALFLDGKPFHFVGTNIYWLMTRAAQRNYELVEQVLDECVKMGLRVVRTWAFWLGPQNSLHPEGSDNHCSAAGCPIGDRAAEALDDSSSAAAPSAPSAELFDRTTAALGQLTGAPQWAAALVLVGATFCGSTMVLATLASRCLRCVAGARHRWLHIVDEPPSAAEL